MLPPPLKEKGSLLCLTIWRKSYAALGKKVILVGADLRNPQLHKFLNQKRENLGLTTYLSNRELQ